jgi:anti-anti-sigma factor
MGAENCTILLATQQGPAAIVQISGEVDMANVDNVRAEVLDAAPEDAEHVVLDLDRLVYLDSAGVRMFFDLSEDLAAGGRSLALALPPGDAIRRVLAITKLDTLIPVRDTLEEAAAARGGGHAE